MQASERPSWAVEANGEPRKGSCPTGCCASRRNTQLCLWTQRPIRTVSLETSLNCVTGLAHSATGDQATSPAPQQTGYGRRSEQRVRLGLAPHVAKARGELPLRALHPRYWAVRGYAEVSKECWEGEPSHQEGP